MCLAAVVSLAAGAPAAHAEGDIRTGERIFEQSCQACHTVEQGGRNTPGPNLFGLLGATAGQRAFGFPRHSPALKNSGIVWSDATLGRFLENPREFIPGVRMPFPGLTRKSDRDDVIAYLKAVTR